MNNSNPKFRLTVHRTGNDKPEIFEFDGALLAAAVARLALEQEASVEEVCLHAVGTKFEFSAMNLEWDAKDVADWFKRNVRRPV